MHLTANISIPQKNFIAIDLHSDNAVICVRRNALNKAGELVGKNIWCGRVSIRDGLDNFIKVLVPHYQDFDHVAVVESTYNWYCLTDATGIAWQMPLKSEAGCFASRIRAPSVKPTSNPPMTVPTLNILPSDCESVLLSTTCR